MQSREAVPARGALAEDLHACARLSDPLLRAAERRDYCRTVPADTSAGSLVSAAATLVGSDAGEVVVCTPGAGCAEAGWASFEACTASAKAISSSKSSQAAAADIDSARPAAAAVRHFRAVMALPPIIPYGIFTPIIAHPN